MPRLFQCHNHLLGCPADPVLLNVNAITTVRRRSDGTIEVRLGGDYVFLDMADEIEALFELLGVRLDVELPTS